MSKHGTPITLWHRCVDFVTEQSAGEWDDKTIADDADKLLRFVLSEQEPLEHALMSIAARARFEQEHPTAMRDTAFSLIEKEANAALSAALAKGEV